MMIVEISGRLTFAIDLLWSGHDETTAYYDSALPGGELLRALSLWIVLSVLS
jgi:hypothetical protein